MAHPARSLVAGAQHQVLGVAFLLLLALFAYLTYGIFNKKFTAYDDVTRKLVRGDGLLAWSPAGYRERRPRRAARRVQVLTPPSTVAAIQAGYAPEVHPSARP